MQQPWCFPLLVVVAMFLSTAAAAQAQGSTSACRGNTSSSLLDLRTKPARVSGCLQPGRTKQVVPNGIPIPLLPLGERPNFIVIMTDDQGWDDFGLHNPSYVHTPNLDRFIRRSTLFDNFYVTPQCGQSRAELLTGRSYPRTSTMLVNGGYDFINTAEETAGEVLGDAGYNTAHFGKWHNGDSLGYEPWHAGFQSSTDCAPGVSANESFYGGKGCLFRYTGGGYGVSNDYYEEALVKEVLQYLHEQPKNDNPFFMYYAPHAIHVSQRTPTGLVMDYPPRFRQTFLKPKYNNVHGTVIDTWAMLEFLDEVLGRLFDFIDASLFAKNTYIMLMADNGPFLGYGAMAASNEKHRKPSKMKGGKSFLYEAGIRTFLAVHGPGVQAGVTDRTLLHAADVLPTIADLAGLSQARPDKLAWDGLSFKNLLQIGGSKADQGMPSVTQRGTSLATEQQRNRFVFTLAPQCWDSDALLELDKDREVIRPQPLMDFDTGGMPNKEYARVTPGFNPFPGGFKACVSVRWKDYKLLGLTGKVYKLQNGSHIEQPCTEVPPIQAAPIATTMASAARAWWQSLIATPHSFAKVTFYLGLGNGSVTNLPANAAHERTKDNIILRASDATGFVYAGDQICFKVKVLASGNYTVDIFYTTWPNTESTTFKFSVGPYADVESGSAPALVAQLPAQGAIQGRSMGALNLLAPASLSYLRVKDAMQQAPQHEACLQLLPNGNKGQPVLRTLVNIRITRRRPSIGGSGPPSNAAADIALTRPSDVGISAANFGKDAPVAPLTPSLDLNGPYGWLKDLVRQEPGKTKRVAGADALQQAADWIALCKRFGWPPGQDLMESMYSVYAETLVPQEPFV